MAALATLRDIKPTRGTAHRNEKLHHNATLREERIAAAQHAVDQLRPLRGRVWVLFPGRSTPSGGPSTTADWAEYVVGRLRGTEVVCHQFWAECEALTMVEGTQSRDLSSREELEKKYNAEYDRWRVGHVEGSHRVHGLRRKANRREMNEVGGYSSTPLRGRGARRARSQAVRVTEFLVARPRSPARTRHVRRVRGPVSRDVCRPGGVGQPVRLVRVTGFQVATST